MFADSKFGKISVFTFLFASLEKGKFSFNFKKGKQIRFSVSHIKYKNQKVTFNTSENTLTILLFQKQEALSEFN